LEHALHPWVTFAIMPVFAFANAGVTLRGVGLDTLLQPLTLGIVGGLFLGKQIGVLGIAAIGAAFGFLRLPHGASWAQMYGVALLTGIGFTMSLFIGTLAFAGDDAAAPLRLGVLAGSILSAVAGYAVLRLAPAARS
jgi:Na+:H+ antiporter, NhaA family